MELKYKQFIDLYNDCESKKCVQKKRTAYRWTFANIQDGNNFLPRYLLPAYENDSKELCVGYALSMFDEADQAIKRLEFVTKGKANLYKKLGTHLSSGVIQEIDGISGVSSTKENTLGHFSIFEYVDTDFSKSFEIVKKLISE